MDSKSSPDMSASLLRTGCLNVSWLSWRTSVWMIPLSWLHLQPAQPRHLWTQGSRATSMSSVWSETASQSRPPGAGQERPQWVMTSSPTVTPISPGVTCVENSSGVFISKVYAAPVSIFNIWIFQLLVSPQTSVVFKKCLKTRQKAKMLHWAASFFSTINMGAVVYSECTDCVLIHG